MAVPRICVAVALASALLVPSHPAPSAAALAPDAPSRGPTAVVDSPPTAVAPVPAPAISPVDGAGSQAAVTARPGWSWPLAPLPQVISAFSPGPWRWSPGHRGVDLAAVTGQPVLAAGAGVITFAAAVAGRGVVVVSHPGGLRTTYEPVASDLRLGTVVPLGAPIGTIEAAGWHCAPRACLHWGLKRGQAYLDPLLLTRRPARPVLLPLIR